jgi:hypothetical protein
MHIETVAELRAQAAHARQLADKMGNEAAGAELRQIADTLDVRADELERREAPNPIQRPIQEA